MNVTLKTPTGAVVGIFAMPPFAMLPEIVNWGSRFFTLQRAAEEPREGAAVVTDHGRELLGLPAEERPAAENPVYVEGMLWVLRPG